MYELKQTPRQIVNELDQYIIGQQAAKKSVAVALRNRYRRLQLDEKMQQDITPKNMLMIGPTGVGENRDRSPIGKNRQRSFRESRSNEIYRSRLCWSRCGVDGS